MSSEEDKTKNPKKSEQDENIEKAGKTADYFKTAAESPEKAAKAYTNYYMRDGSFKNYTPGMDKTKDLVAEAERSIRTLERVRVNVPRAANMAEALAIMKRITILQTVAKIGGSLAKILGPIVEFPTSWELNKDSDQRLLASVVDAATFGWLRSLAKTVDLTKYVGVSEEALKEWDSAVDKNLNFKAVADRMPVNNFPEKPANL